MKLFFYTALFLQYSQKPLFIKDGWFQNAQGLIVWSNLSFNLIPVILILPILYLHKGIHVYDCNFIMLFLVLLQKQTFMIIYIRVLISLFIYQFRTFYAHLMLLFGGTSRRCPVILWSACDYNSNTSSNMSHWSSRGYIFPWKHAGFNSEKV